MSNEHDEDGGAPGRNRAMSDTTPDSVYRQMALDPIPIVEGCQGLVGDITVEDLANLENERMATRNEPLHPGVRIHCTDMQWHEVPGLRPGDVTSRRMFRFSCDVELRGYETKAENGPTWLSLEFVGVGQPMLEEIPSP